MLSGNLTHQQYCYAIQNSCATNVVLNESIDQQLKFMRKQPMRTWDTVFSCTRRCFNYDSEFDRTKITYLFWQVDLIKLLSTIDWCNFQCMSIYVGINVHELLTIDSVKLNDAERNHQKQRVLTCFVYPEINWNAIR